MQPIIDIIPTYTLKLFVSFALFFGLSFLLFLMAKRTQKIGYSFGFFITNIVRLRRILPTKTPLGFFNFLFIFSMLFLFIIRNLISSGIKVGLFRRSSSFNPSHKTSGIFTESLY